VPLYIPRLLEDQADYDDDAPWPAAPDGGGHSLHRTTIDAWGNETTGWKAAFPTPGTVDFAPVVVDAEVVGRHIYYNESAYDGRDTATNAADDGAIAPDKAALLPGETATVANYTNYIQGINGLMIDVVGLVDGPGLSATADFAFRVGNDDAPGSWADAPAPTSLAVREGAGIDGSDRITITWSNQAIVGQWLQVTVLANETTGLSNDDVFYFGNAIGEVGDSTEHAMVTTADEIVARNSYRGLADPALIDEPADFNRDRLVNVADRLIARNYRTGLADTLKLITPATADGLMATFAEQSATSSESLDWVAELDQSTDQAKSKRTSLQAAIDILLASFAP